ncbi:MAG: hypothetical protein PHR20_02295 [Bacteroidales bacterium]|nr:hypothetical protein [Bacteroidales bacterium]
MIKHQFSYSRLFLSFLVLPIVLFSSCNIGAGEGGTGSVQGYVKIIMHYDDNYVFQTDTFPAAKKDVFIKYGDNDYFDDDVETDNTGLFRFKYLRPGEYTVYAYSELVTGELVATEQSITIRKNEDGTVEDMYIHDGKAYGTSMVKGHVYATYMHNGVIIDEGWAYEHRVYISNIDEDFYFDDVRVGDSGVFMFQKILPGTYKVSTITEDINEIPSYINQTVIIEEADTTIDVPETFQVIINV